MKASEPAGRLPVLSGFVVAVRYWAAKWPHALAHGFSSQRVGRKRNRTQPNLATPLVALHYRMEHGVRQFKRSSQNDFGLALPRGSTNGDTPLITDFGAPKSVINGVSPLVEPLG